MRYKCILATSTSSHSEPEQLCRSLEHWAKKSWRKRIMSRERGAAGKHNNMTEIMLFWLQRVLSYPVLSLLPLSHSLLCPGFSLTILVHNILCTTLTNHCPQLSNLPIAASNAASHLVSFPTTLYCQQLPSEIKSTKVQTLGAYSLYRA